MKSAEHRFANLGVIGSDIEGVKKQIKQLKDFKDDVDPYMVKVESLNRLVLLSIIVYYVFVTNYFFDISIFLLTSGH